MPETKLHDRSATKLPEIQLMSWPAYRYDLNEIATGLSPSAVHRICSARTGVTTNVRALAAREERMGESEDPSATQISTLSRRQ